MMGWKNISWSHLISILYLGFIFFTREINWSDLFVGAAGVVLLQIFEVSWAIKNKSLGQYYRNRQDEAIVFSILALVLFGLYHFGVSFTLSGRAWTGHAFLALAAVFAVMSAAYFFVTLVLLFAGKKL